MRKDAAGDAVRTEAAGTVFEGGDVAQDAVQGISSDLGDGGRGKGKGVDEDRPEEVVEEATTLTPGEECATDVQGEGEEAAEKADAGDASERRPSSNLVERVKRRGRTRKLALVRLSP